MNKHSNIWLMALIIVIVTSTITCVSYAENTAQVPPQVALDSGDTTNAQTLLDALFKEHPQCIMYYSGILIEFLSIDPL